jgi:hypothetical protein
VPKPVRATHDDFPRQLSDGLGAPPSADLEMLLLCALCQAPAGAARNELLWSLQRHEWCDPEQGLIFQTLAELSRCSGDELRRALPAHLTRAGFPDTDVNAFFTPLQWNGNSLLDFVEELGEMLAPGAKPNRKPKSKPASKAMMRRPRHG